MLSALSLSQRLRSTFKMSALRAPPILNHVDGGIKYGILRLSSVAIDIEAKYASPLRWMHWVYAAGFLTVVGTVKVKQNVSSDTFLGSKGETQATLMMIHKSTAVVTAALFAPRILLKVATKAPGPLPGSGTIEHLASQISHSLLYAFMLVMPATGMAMGYYGGKGIPFYGYTIPGKADRTKEDGKFAGTMFKWHKWTGQFLPYIIPVHVGAAGYHALKGQPIFTRINPLA